MDGIYPAKPGTTAKPSADSSSCFPARAGAVAGFWAVPTPAVAQHPQSAEEEADVGMEILLVHFTAEELSHEA